MTFVEVNLLKVVEKMQIIKMIGSAFLLAMPSFAIGQGIYTSQNQTRPMKAVENAAIQDSVKNAQTAQVNTPKANPFPASTSQIKSAGAETKGNKKEGESKEVVLAMNNNVTTKVIKKNTPPANPQVISAGKVNEPAIKGPLDYKYEHNGKYNPVPLAGELNYFKTNNDFMLSYTSKYMKTFNARLKSLSTPKKVGYLKTIDRIFDKHNIPRELKYLAVIESALNSGATSPVGAHGYWQFMAPTARLMGLTVNGGRDDRADLHKSTNAAAKYLSYLYDQFDDWLLVVAAYNSGPRPVINAIKKTGKADYWVIKKYLPKETQNHVLAFVATATIMERMPHYASSNVPTGFEWKSLNINRKSGGAIEQPETKRHPLFNKFTEDEIGKMAVVRISKPIDLEYLSDVLKSDRRMIGKWNYDYLTYIQDYKSGSTYNLRIPKDKLEVYLEKKYEIEAKLMQL